MLRFETKILNPFLNLLLLLISLSVFGQSEVYFTESGTVSFVSEAPLEVIKAQTNKVKAAINIADQSFMFVLNNAGFEGFNSPLQQEHFHENYMETKTFPQSSFKGKIIEPVVWSTGKTQILRAKGILDVHGVKQERIIKASITFDEETLHIHADFMIPLEDHHIRIPKVVARKIATEIQVNVSCTLVSARPNNGTLP